MQLVAYGAQDIYLTGNPQITFFKVVYRRHTNFSMESIKQTFNGTADFGNDVTATISRNGDLVYRMYLEHDATFTDTTTADANQLNIVERYGDSLIKECEIEIGGQRIDKHTSMWKRVYSDLTQSNPSGHFGATVGPGGTTPSGNGTLYQLMTGNTYGFNTGDYDATNNKFGVNGADGSGDQTITINGITYTRGDEGTSSADALPAKVAVNKVFLPLDFWFNRNPGLALPLIALQYHEVKVKMTFESLGNLSREIEEATFTDSIPATASTVTAAGNFELWCDYIYLDTDERRRFAQVSHEYLIEQLQYSENTLQTASPSIDLNFNHPVKELIWCMRNEKDSTTGGRHQTPAAGKGDACSGPTSIDEMGGNWQLKLNGHDRFKERDSKYFTRTQVWQHHTGYGGISTTMMHSGTGDLNDPDTAADVGSDSIAVYSFALKPEEHQPSGTCNFSRIDNAQLVGNSIQVAADIGGLASTGDATANNTKLTIFAVNYNVLRIMSGMGGLAYSN